MSVKLKISITKEILERSKDCNVEDEGSVGSNCAIAVALRDIFPQAWVQTEDVIPFFDENATIPGLKKQQEELIQLPIEAQSFIAEFDSLSPEERSKMETFDFEVNIPDAVIDEINIEELKETLLIHPNLQLV